MKTLILIVAYEAEKHIQSVLSRIPWSRLQGGGEVLVLDDASTDNTSEFASSWMRPNSAWPIQVLKNPVNLGYGGNQKVGYRYAVEHNFDHVVLLHGDGQYAPELVPEMIEPLISKQADAVFGSRMLSRRSALSGGMPFYKWVANQIVTSLENRILSASLSEFHTGYRAYDCHLLSRIPFELNTNNFHFDTEIIIQIIRAGGRIREIAIPTYYGTEICRVNGWKYCWGCLKSCLESWCTDAGIFYARRFDVLTKGDDRYASKIHLHGSSHAEAIKLIQPGSRVIDLGGGNGWIAKHLVTEKACEVTILDEEIHATPIPRLSLHIHDLNKPLCPLGPTDSILLLDVLEHLERRRQRELLGEVRDAYPQLPMLLITVPNTSFLPLRLVFLLTGRLNYGRRGILDETHRFLFSRHSLKELLSDTMFSITSLKGLPPPIGLLPIPKWVTSILEPILNFLVSLLPGLFAYQWICASTPMPSADSLLSKTKSFS